MIKGLFSLTPLILFLCLYLGTSIYLQDFYKIPITVAFLISAVYAVAISKGALTDRIKVFSKGAGSDTMMLMLWIFLLAGAFAATAKTMGAVESTVNFTLTVLPQWALLPGLFLAACFISLAVGTSVGTISALTPVAVGIAAKSGIGLPLVLGLIVGGAYFGDNLSFISDTTIVATQTQGCKMSDKFKVNVRIVVPVAVLVLVSYFFIGTQITTIQNPGEFSFMKILPYLWVIVSAVLGLNVLLVLASGTLIAGVVGICMGSYDVYGWFGVMAQGMFSMDELIIMTLLAAGMLAMIKENGGIDFIIKCLVSRVRGKRGAEACIALMASLVDACTANNTVALITVGPIAKEVAKRYGVDPRKSASLLDTASCFTQGLLPYAAQMLIAANLASKALGYQVSPINILPYLFYPMALILAVVLSIVFRYPRRYN